MANFSKFENCLMSAFTVQNPSKCQISFCTGLSQPRPPCNFHFVIFLSLSKKKFSLLYSFFQFNFVTLFVKFFHLIFFPGMVSPCCLFPPTMKCFTLLLLPPIVTRCLLFHIEPHKLNLRRVFAYKVSFQAVLSFILSTFSNNLLFHFAQERKRPPLCFSTR